MRELAVPGLQGDPPDQLGRQAAVVAQLCRGVHRAEPGAARQQHRARRERDQQAQRHADHQLHQGEAESSPAAHVWLPGITGKTTIGALAFAPSAR